MILEKEFIMRLINDNTNIGKTAIKPADIGVKAYRDAYRELLKQMKAGHKPDLLSIISALDDHYVLLVEMNAVETSNFEYYEKKLSGEIQRKRLALVKEFLEENLQRQDVEIKDLAARVEKMIVGSFVTLEQKEIKSFYDAAMEFGPVLEERHRLKGALPGVTAGFSLLDSMTGGFQPGVIYIGARPSQGKTALMLSMARSAIHSGHGVGIISIESSSMDLISRLISADGNVPAGSLKHGTLKASEFNSLSDTLTRFKGYNGQLYFNTKTDVETLEAVSRVMVEVHGVDIIFVDYLQRVYAKGGSKFEQVANASRAVTDIAKGLGVPVVCLAQTGRVADHEAPSLNHFQYSSAIEQDADVAMVIHNFSDSQTAAEEREGITRSRTELVVLKNRDGETGTVPVFFNKRFIRFEEVGNK